LELAWRVTQLGLVGLAWILTMLGLERWEGMAPGRKRPGPEVLRPILTTGFSNNACSLILSCSTLNPFFLENMSFDTRILVQEIGAVN
jgi:hypothetical protein